jgi:hypothetical protein
MSQHAGPKTSGYPISAAITAVSAPFALRSRRPKNRTASQMEKAVNAEPAIARVASLMAGSYRCADHAER